MLSTRTGRAGAPGCHPVGWGGQGSEGLLSLLVGAGDLRGGLKGQAERRGGSHQTPGAPQRVCTLASHPGGTANLSPESASCSSWPGAGHHSLVLTNAFSGRVPLPQPQQECREGIGANVAATTAPPPVRAASVSHEGGQWPATGGR